MMQVIDQGYLRAMVALPDGYERLERWVHSLIAERETAEAIAKACVRDIQPLRRQVEHLQAANSQLVLDRRDLRTEMQAEIDAAFAELDQWREGARPLQGKD